MRGTQSLPTPCRPGWGRSQGTKASWPAVTHATAGHGSRRGSGAGRPHCRGGRGTGHHTAGLLSEVAAAAMRREQVPLPPHSPWRTRGPVEAQGEGGSGSPVLGDGGGLADLLAWTLFLSRGPGRGHDRGQPATTGQDTWGAWEPTPGLAVNVPPLLRNRPGCPQGPPCTGTALTATPHAALTREGRRPVQHLGHPRGGLTLMHTHARTAQGGLLPERYKDKNGGAPSSWRPQPPRAPRPHSRH